MDNKALEDDTESFHFDSDLDFEGVKTPRVENE